MGWKWRFGVGCVSALLLCSTSVVQADDADAIVILGQAAEVAADRTVEAAIVVGGDLTVHGHVSGAAIAVGGALRVAPGARVDGLTAAVGGPLQVDQGARVVGPRVQVAGGDFSHVVADLAEAAEGAQPGEGAPPVWVGSLLRMFQVLALFVIGVFLVLLAPRQVQAVRRTLVAQPAQVTLTGLLLLLGFVPLCVLLAVSVIGIPLIPVAVLLLLASFILGLTGLGVAVGFRIPVVRGEDNVLGALTAGLLALLLVAVIPLLGGMLLFVASFYSAGGAIMSRFGTRAPPSQPTEDRAQPAEAPTPAKG